MSFSQGNGNPHNASKARVASTGGSSASRGRLNNKQSKRGDHIEPRRAASTSRDSLGDNNGFTTRGRERSSFGSQTFARTALSQVQNAGDISWHDRYAALQESRKQERADAIKNGLLADPNQPRRLEEAITLVGTCQDMCAEFERVERVVQKDVWKEETDPGHITANSYEREPAEERMIKKFRRAAAGIEEQLPSDLRPPPVLKKTCDYLFNVIVGEAVELGRVHHFVWDRTRAIRNDFSIQQLSKAEDLSIAIDCYERIARFHILSLHQLAVPKRPYDKYDWQQEREQLDRTLLSLIQYYDDSRHKIDLPNEPEFRAYCVVFQLQDPFPDLEDRLQSWSKAITLHPRVQSAVALYSAACNVITMQGPLKQAAPHVIAQQDWHKFWQLIESKQTSYLMACVAEIYFNLIRRNILHALLKSTSTKSTGQWLLKELRLIMAMDDEDQTEAFCETFDLSFKDTADKTMLDFSTLKNRQLPPSKPAASKQIRSALVEQKRFGRSLPAVINGLTVQQARTQGQIETSLLDAKAIHTAIDDTDDAMEEESSEEGLFVSDETTKTSNRDSILAAPSVSEVRSSPFMPRKASDASTHATATFGKASNTQIQTSSTFGKASSPPFQAKSTFGKASSPPNQAVSTFGRPSGSTIQQPATSFGKPSANPAVFPGNPFSTIKKDSTPQFNFLSGLKNVNNDTASAQATKFSQAFSASDQKLQPFEQPLSHGPPETVDASTLASQRAASTSLATTPIQTKEQASCEPMPPSPADTSTKTSNIFSKSVFGNVFKPLSRKETDASQMQFPVVPPSSNTTNIAQPPQSSLSSPAKPPSSKQQPPATIMTTIAESAGSKPRSPFQPFAPQATPANAEKTLDTHEPGTLQKSNGDGSVSPPASRSHQQEVSKQSNTPVMSKPKIQRTQTEPTAQPVPSMSTILQNLATGFTMSPTNGFLLQYVDFVVSTVITDVQEQMLRERVEQEAKDFRTSVLSNRYGRLWREICRLRRLAKHGRAQRQRAMRRLHNRQDQTYDMSHRVGCESPRSEPAKEGIKSRRDVVDAMFQQSLKHSRSRASSASRADLRSSTQAHTNGNMGPPSVPASVISAQSKNARIDRSGKIIKPGTVPSQTSGFNRIGSAQSPARSTTKSNYFRQKALGVDVSPVLNGYTRKRGYSELSSMSSLASTSSSTRSSPAPQSEQNAENAQAITKLHKTGEEDDAILARLRAARESLRDESTSYQGHLARSGLSVSLPSTSVEWDASTMALARQSAREGSDVPAYRLRESKFVSPDNYSKAIERARSIRASRSAASSRPESRVGNHDGTPAYATSNSNVGVREKSPNEITGIYAQTAELPGAATVRTQSRGTQSNASPDAVEDGRLHSRPSAQPNGVMTGSSATRSSVNAEDVHEDRSSTNENHDFTIKPSQIPASLSASFGSKQGSAQKPSAPASFANPFAALEDEGDTWHDQNDSEPRALSNEDEDESEPGDMDDEAMYDEDQDAGYGQNYDDSEDEGHLDSEDLYESEADSEDYDNRPQRAPVANATLQTVGNTEADAIELSD